MAKVDNKYETSKIVVDYYSEHAGIYTCSCYTPGAASTIEPEYLVKKVTHYELRDHLTDSNGKVLVTYYMDEATEISYDQFISELSSRHIERYLTEIINKREGRKYSFANIHESMAL